MRLKPLPPAELDAGRRPLHDDMARIVAEKLHGFVSSREDGALIGPFPPMLHFPQFGRPAWEFTKALIDHAQLPKQVREVAILVAGAKFHSRYEIYAHEAVAEGTGLDVATIATITAGQRPADLPHEQQLAYDFAAAQVAGMQIPASLYGLAQTAFGDDGVAELVYLVGLYSMVSQMLNAWDVPVPGNDDDAAA